MVIQDLKKENEKLRKKLLVAKTWMQKEIKNQKQIILKEKAIEKTFLDKKSFFTENIEDIVINTVETFFGELMLLNTSETVIENIISAEILFFNLRENKKTDGLWVITSYNKSMDFIIETTITKWFRKYAKKMWQIQLRTNDPLEKTLNLVVNKWYILWVWKLFHVLSNIKNNKELYDYSKCFKNFLEKYAFIKQILLNEDFFKKFEKLMSLDVFWKKRHIWKIWYEDVKNTRSLLIWDFKDTNSIIYKLIEMWQPDF